MANRAVVLIHGYSDEGGSFDLWKEALVQQGYPTTDLSVCSYETLTNELTIKDIAEGFDRALAIKAGLDKGEPFDAIVHSTGMLVVRSWLTAYSTSDPRRNRLKHLVGLAPATWGSPLAHKGRSLIGSIFKGRKELGPDFMEAGNQILDGLELGSRFTWDLAHRDLLTTEPFYGPTRATPFVFIFCGNRGYRGLRELINEDGTDGTVRWAGCSLDARKIVLDLTGGNTPLPDAAPRVAAPIPANADVPVTFVDDTDHGGIIRQPPQGLVQRVLEALQVGTAADFAAWQAETAKWSASARGRIDKYQQFVVRLIDERGDPVPDYHLQLLTQDGDKIRPFDTDVHVYRRDPSLRSFHVNLSKLKPDQQKGMLVRLIASSGTARVGYAGVGTEKVTLQGQLDREGKWDAQFSLPAEVDDGVSFFYPFTTTLVEIRINREPLPLVGPNEVLWFLPKH
jgi:hypothetical protein